MKTSYHWIQLSLLGRQLGYHRRKTFSNFESLLSRNSFEKEDDGEKKVSFTRRTPHPSLTAGTLVSSFVRYHHLSVSVPPPYVLWLHCFKKQQVWLHCFKKQQVWLHCFKKQQATKQQTDRELMIHYKS